MQVIAKNKQTLLDIALQEYGDIAAATMLAYYNNLPIDNVLLVGQMIECPYGEYKPRVAKIIKQKGIIPVTNI